LKLGLRWQRSLIAKSILLKMVKHYVEAALTKVENIMATFTSTNETDVVLVGAGIMSATLAVFQVAQVPQLPA
jgi:Malate:quinone oxidoreductase (Mqo)